MLLPQEKQKIIQDLFNDIKDKIIIPAQIQKYSLKNITLENVDSNNVFVNNAYVNENVLYVKMSININQFRQWLYNNCRSGLFYIRDLWYLFLDYINDIFNYGYHFNNINQINRFLEKNNHIISQLDGIISNLPYNICAAAEIYKPVITKDKNDFIFYIITEAYELDTEIDKNAVNNIFVNDDETEDNDEEIIVENKEEETQRLLKQYEKDNCNHARIAYNVIQKQQNELDDLTFIKQMELTPRVIKHIQNDKTISLLWSISKTQFIYNFSMLRKNNSNQAWIAFKNDFLHNYNQYNCINKKCMDEYLVSINQCFNQIVNEIYDVDISRENNIKFWTKIQVK